MGKKIIRPIKGIDVDSSPNRRDDNTIYMAKNMRLNNNEDSHLGEYTNIKGSNLVVSDTADYKILKVCKVANKFVLFVKMTSGVDPDKICQILEADIPLNGETPITLNTDYALNYNNFNTTSNVIVSGEFGFDSNKEINVKTYYESDTVQKIYWNIEGQSLRSLNIIFSDNNNPSIYTADDLGMTPSSVLSEPAIDKIITGRLLCGKIFYAYKLVNSNGSETQLSSISKGVNLTTASANELNDYLYAGGGIDVNSNKGVSIKIENIPTGFTKIKVYSIHFADDVSSPIISLVYDGSVDSTFITSDIGNPIIVISPEEFIATNGLNFKDGQLEIKNNRLFVANYTEDFFDIDEAINGYWESRAYRFTGGNGPALLFDNDLINYKTIPFNTTTFTDNGLTTTHDCINRSNNITFWSLTLTDNFIYKQASSDIGATGLNIEISQAIETYVYPDKGAEVIKWNSPKSSSLSTPPTSGGYTSYANPLLDANNKTFIPEEVYRIAIQFRNEKNQYSYPKWICDYKYIRDLAETQDVVFTGTTGYNSTNMELKMGINVLKVTVNDLPMNTNVSPSVPYEYRIVYVPVTDDEQSVFYGLFTSLFKVNTNTDYRACSLSRADTTNAWLASNGTIPVTQSSRYLEFVSPDYCFGNKKSYVRINLMKKAITTDLLFLDNSLGKTAIENITSPFPFNKYLSNIYKPYKYSNIITPNILTKSVSKQVDIEYNIDMETKIPLDGGDFFMRNGEVITTPNLHYRYYETNWGFGLPFDGRKGSAYGNANKGRCQIIKPSETTFIPLQCSIFGCAYVDNFLSRYGGLSYSARKSNGYIPLSNFTSAQGSAQTVYGDSYAGVFEYLRQISDNETPYISSNAKWIDGYIMIPFPEYMPGANEIIMFPTYSRINLKLRSDEYFSKLYTKPGAYMLHEYAGVYQDTYREPNGDGVMGTAKAINREDAIFTQKTDLYLYNQSYSRQQDTIKFYPKQNDAVITKVFKNRINASDLKILGESVDSFLRFNPSTYIDVDGQYGEIKALKAFNDRLYFFQEKAIGIVAVNEQATTNLASEASLVLGNVGLLSRYDYITINNGINDSNHIVTSDNYLYGVDEIRRELFRLNGDKLEKISITKNVNSFIKNNDLSNSRIVYNRKYNEVLFFYKIPNISYHHSLVFNEMQDCFIGTRSNYKLQKDSVPIERTDIIDEIVLDSAGNIYTLNDGNYNQFNGNYIPSEITFLIPSTQEDVVLFNTIEFIMKQVDSSNAFVNFIDSIRIYNSKYDTGTIDFNSNVVEKFGEYRTSKLRNYIGSNERMLTDHIYVKIITDANSTQSGPNNYRVFFRDMIASFSEYNYFG